MSPLLPQQGAFCYSRLVVNSFRDIGWQRYLQPKSEHENAPMNQPDYFLIDVRTQEEWDSGHIEFAHHIPHQQILDGIEQVTTDKAAKIYFY